MVDEHKLLKDADRASKVQSLLDNEYLKEAFRHLEESYLERWRLTDNLDTASREKLFMAVKVLDEVQKHLTTALSDGKLAAHQLKSLAERPKRFSMVY